MSFPKILTNFPPQPGIYIMKDENETILYVGKAKNLKERIKSYFSKNQSLGPKTKRLVERVKKINYIKVESELEALLLEAELIRRNQPTFNVDLKDGKAYPFIKITTREKCPTVQTVRHELDDGSQYFGPYPNTGNVRYILKKIRKIFPFVSAKTHPRKLCFHYHLGLCPCPMIDRNSEKTQSYRKTIKNIILLLKGKKKSLTRRLKREMKETAKREDYEKAQTLKRQIQTLEEITSPIRQPALYLGNPNLVDDTRVKEREDLAAILIAKNVAGKDFFPDTLEAYDISNIQGKEATGGMVRFQNGEADKSMYRRFKIKTEEKANDIAMLGEVLERRLNHKNWPLPDLFLVDGGRGQVKKALEVLRATKVDVPVIGLAKRMEEIVIPQRCANGKLVFESLLLPQSAALNLLKRVRDEAHRFALKYHHHLSLKKLTNTIKKFNKIDK